MTAPTLPPLPEQFTNDQTAQAIGQFLDFGEQSAGTAHQGYFSGGGWAARCLRAHLAALQSAAPQKQRLTEDVHIGNVRLCAGSVIDLLIDHARMLDAEVERLQSAAPAAPQPGKDG